MLKIGEWNQLRVTRLVEFGAYLSDGEQDVLLPRKYVPEGAKPNDQLEVFVCHDSNDRIVATTQQPLAKVGDIACLTVKDANQYGAFLDWGLEKDLMVPFGHQEERMLAGRKYVVKVLFDPVSGRIIASNRFRKLAKGDPAKLKVAQEVAIVILKPHRLGFQCLINGECLGMLYRNEIYQTITMGMKLTAFVDAIRPDGRIDVVLREPGFNGVLREKEGIVEILKNSGGSVPVNSESSPEKIKAAFNMSKKTFKRAIGNLYKERRITIDDNGIRLV